MALITSGCVRQTGRQCVSPIAQTLPSGRTVLKMATGYQRPATAAQKAEAKRHGSTSNAASAAVRDGWEQEDDATRDQAMIDCYKDAIFSATQHAPRFKLLAGAASPRPRAVSCLIQKWPWCADA